MLHRGAQPGSASWDGEVDLRRYVTALFRHKWLILAVPAAALAVTWAINYRALTPIPVYESTGILALPAPANLARLGATPPDYLRMAGSPEVQERIRVSSNRQLPTGADLGSRFRFDLDLTPNGESLTVTATAPHQEQALALAEAWIAAFAGQLEADVTGQFTQLKDAATQKKSSLQSRLAQAEASLAQAQASQAGRERESARSLTEARLRALEQELVAGEVRLRQLTASSIPLEQTKLAYLQKTLEETPKTIQAPAPGLAGGTADLNPVYLQIDQEAASTAWRLAVSRKEAEVLAGNLPLLAGEAKQLRATMTAGEIPEQLALETRKLGEAYTTAAAELERLLEVEARIPHLSPVKTIQLPALPSAPVSSGGGLNLVLVGTLAAFLVISAVLLREWYGGTPPASTPRRLGTLDGASQDAAEEQPAGEHARVPAPVN